MCGSSASWPGCCPPVCVRSPLTRRTPCWSCAGRPRRVVWDAWLVSFWCPSCVRGRACWPVRCVPAPREARTGQAGVPVQECGWQLHSPAMHGLPHSSSFCERAHVLPKLPSPLLQAPAAQRAAARRSRRSRRSSRHQAWQSCVRARRSCGALALRPTRPVHPRHPPGGRWVYLTHLCFYPDAGQSQIHYVSDYTHNDIDMIMNA